MAPKKDTTSSRFVEVRKLWTDALVQNFSIFKGINKSVTRLLIVEHPIVLDWVNEDWVTKLESLDDDGKASFVEPFIATMEAASEILSGTGTEVVPVLQREVQDRDNSLSGPVKEATTFLQPGMPSKSFSRWTKDMRSYLQSISGLLRSYPRADKFRFTLIRRTIAGDSVLSFVDTYMNSKLNVWDLDLADTLLCNETEWECFQSGLLERYPSVPPRELHAKQLLNFSVNSDTPLREALEDFILLAERCRLPSSDDKDDILSGLTAGLFIKALKPEVAKFLESQSPCSLYLCGFGKLRELIEKFPSGKKEYANFIFGEDQGGRKNPQRDTPENLRKFMKVAESSLTPEVIQQFKEAKICAFCKKYGHVSERCYSKKRTLTPGPVQLALIGANDPSQILLSSLRITRTTEPLQPSQKAVSPSSEVFYAQIRNMNGDLRKTQILLDGGSKAHVISLDLVQALGWPIHPSSTNLTLGSSDFSIDSMGTTRGLLRLDTSDIEFQFLVLKNPAVDVILGKHFFERAKLEYVSPYQRNLTWNGKIIRLQSTNSPREDLSKQDKPSEVQGVILISSFSPTGPSDESDIVSQNVDVSLSSVLPEDLCAELQGLQVGGTEEQKMQVFELLRRYKHLFRNKMHGGPPPSREGFDVSIMLKPDAVPFAARNYRLSEIQLQELLRQLKELLAANIIKPSKSPFASPIVFVKKRSGEYRLCIDYKRLNSMVVPVAYPIPDLPTLLHELSGSRVFSTIDLISAYHQLRVDAESQYLTAFTTPYGLYEFVGTPFGLRDAPAYFHKLIDSVCRPLKGQGVIAYFDDITIHSASFEEHLRLLEQVFNLFQQAKLFFKPTKTIINAASIEFLGRWISNGKVYPLERHVSAVRNYPRPLTFSQLRGFLGLCTWLAPTIKNAAFLMKPLFSLLKGQKQGTQKKLPVNAWGDVQQIAFDKLKEVIASLPCFFIPRFDGSTFHLHCDASDIGVGAILFQQIDSVDQPVGFYSHCFSSSQRIWPTFEKELAAVVWSLQHFSPIIRDYPHLAIRTDSRVVEALLSPKGKPTQKVARWIAEIQQFHFTIEHIPGLTNVVPDAFSRAFVAESLNNIPIQPTLLSMSVVPSFSPWGVSEELYAFANALSDCSLSQGDEEQVRRLDLVPKNGLYLSPRQQIFVPEAFRPRILHLCHDAMGHFGVPKHSLLLYSASFGSLSCKTSMITSSDVSSAKDVNARLAHVQDC